MLRKISEKKNYFIKFDPIELSFNFDLKTRDENKIK